MPVKKPKTVALDVREDIAQGREPCSLILSTVAKLRAGERLKLIAPFEPVPLFSLLAMQGFEHQATPLANGEWEVLFFRPSAA